MGRRNEAVGRKMEAWEKGAGRGKVLRGGGGREQKVLNRWKVKCVHLKGKEGAGDKSTSAEKQRKQVEERWKGKR